MALIVEFEGRRPQIAESAYIAPNATVIGDVTIGEEANIWYGAVLRGDAGAIAIGARTSVQDNVVVHVNGRHDTLVGADVVIGHGVVLEGCTIGDGALLGMNATILSGATIGPGALIAAGAVVREGGVVPAGSLAAGVPAEVKKELNRALQERIRRGAAGYVSAAQKHRRNIVLER